MNSTHSSISFLSDHFHYSSICLIVSVITIKFLDSSHLVLNINYHYTYFVHISNYYDIMDPGKVFPFKSGFLSSSPKTRNLDQKFYFTLNMMKFTIFSLNYHENLAANFRQSILLLINLLKSMRSNF